MANKTKILKMGELFCGPGGLAKGALLATSACLGVTSSIVSAWANDNDKDSCQTYALNMVGDINSEEVICADAGSLDIASLAPIDIFAYGFPCNDFSVVGERLGLAGKFGHLYQYGIEVLNLHKPKVVVVENVAGLSSIGSGKVFAKILQDIAGAGNGYNLSVHLYKSQDYGVPQTRHRWIIVGIDKKLGLRFKVPAPTHQSRPMTVKAALAGIPQNALNNEPASMTKTVAERLKYIKPGQNAWNADLPANLKLNVKAAKLSQIYKRLDPDKPAYTITGSGGGGTHGYHHIEPRPLTNRERARLQTFPDDFKFIGNYSSVRRQIGMAVPVKLSQVIFTAILDTLNDKDYSSVEPNFTFKPKAKSKLTEAGFNLKTV
ncbi:MAG TPA: DNA (cytosine-5-)-methyltransferase [Candidatus Saccharimonadales bacterium]|nr:DNA (cytosine-5-)-methyltransferase [Candidatus Saccharimonadales bacterium]